MLATGRLLLGCGRSTLFELERESEREPGAETPDSGVGEPPPPRPAAGTMTPTMTPTRAPPRSRRPARFDAGVVHEGPTRSPPSFADEDAGPDLLSSDPRSVLATLGPLRDPDANGLRLPSGFSSRLLARTGRVVAPSSYVWHPAPDGGATFATLDGGYVYVSNCEYTPGGASALRFDARGELVDAYSILQQTQRNCAGGPTPWGAFLSCEEWAEGAVWECDPLGAESAMRRPALGLFQHEAAAVDPVRMHIYLTEDQPDGRLYRFTPRTIDRSGRPDLERGVLEVAHVTGTLGGSVSWLPVPDPSGADLATRFQLPESTAFNGGEGIWHHAGVIYFVTKGDNRVWAHDLQRQELTVLYDLATSDNPILAGPDNVTATLAGDIVVAEDVGGDMQLVGITADGTPVALLQLVGHDGSELAGPAFDPSGTRLYVSSQRGTMGTSEDGYTFEISGPFFAPG